MEKEPRIAVVITCFNYETYVGKAIRSVLDQKTADCELVVIDDGSTDRSWDVIQETGARAYRIANGGQRSACLYGLGQTRAPFVLFLDADDELAPGALVRILQVLDPGVAKVQFCLTCIDATGRVITERYPPWRPSAARTRWSTRSCARRLSDAAEPPGTCSGGMSARSCTTARTTMRWTA